MRTGAWLCLGCLALSAATAAGQDASEPTEMFQALWFQQHLLRDPSHRLVVAEIISPKPHAKLAGTQDITLRIVKDFNRAEGQPPMPEQVALKRILAPVGPSPATRPRSIIWRPFACTPAQA